MRLLNFHNLSVRVSYIWEEQIFQTLAERFWFLRVGILPFLDPFQSIVVFIQIQSVRRSHRHLQMYLRLYEMILKSEFYQNCFICVPYVISRERGLCETPSGFCNFYNQLYNYAQFYVQLRVSNCVALKPHENKQNKLSLHI